MVVTRRDIGSRPREIGAIEELIRRSRNKISVNTERDLHSKSGLPREKHLNAD